MKQAQRQEQYERQPPARRPAGAIFTSGWRAAVQCCLSPPLQRCCLINDSAMPDMTDKFY